MPVELPGRYAFTNNSNVDNSEEIDYKKVCKLRFP